MFRQQASALIWEMNGETVCVEPWGRDSLRVRARKGQAVLDASWALLPPEHTRTQVEISTERGTLRNGNITAEMGASGRLRFLNTSSGAPLLEETASGHFFVPPARDYTALSSDLFRTEARFTAYAGERIYGLGQHKHGFLDQKGCVITLDQRNTEVSIPFLLSSRGYGFLWHNPAVGRVELGVNGTHWVAEASRQIDYWITAAATPASILERYTDATGHAPLLPAFASGFWQCKLRYRTQEELLSVAREYKRRGLPLSVIVIDFLHWPQFGDWKLDPIAWPDPAAMVRELQQMGVTVMVSVWPSVHRESENYETMDRQGLLIGAERGLPFQVPFIDPASGRLIPLQNYDATNPAARRFLWDKVRENYYRYGIKVWWLDACEPEQAPIHHENLRYFLGNGMEVGCIYPMLHEQGFYDGMTAEGEKEIIMLSRSAWAGAQRYGVAVWSGDIQSSFEHLRQQVRAGMNIGLSGIPWWTTDIGGFWGGNIDSPSFRELIVRWFQFGAFCPLFRLHGYREDGQGRFEAPNEIWSFGPEAEKIISGLLFLRERLRPYIMQQMEQAHATGTPPMRPLFFDFPTDEGCVSVDDEFMFGPDILVAPVLEEGARSRRVYLPAGTHWTDAWSGHRLSGGTSITADAPLHKIPLYLRGDKKLPIAA
jgi:alpha-D-xyloside xylohydrolase